MMTVLLECTNLLILVTNCNMQNNVQNDLVQTRELAPP